MLWCRKPTLHPSKYIPFRPNPPFLFASAGSDVIDRPWDALTLQCTSSQRTESLQRSIKSLQQNNVVVGEMDQRKEGHGFKVPVGAHCSLLTHDGLHGSANMSPQTLTPSATSRLPVAPRLRQSQICWHSSVMSSSVDADPSVSLQDARRLRVSLTYVCRT